MAKFMILYKSSASAREQMANVDPEAMEAGMALWAKWAEKAGNDHPHFHSPGASVEVLEFLPMPGM